MSAAMTSIDSAKSGRIKKGQCGTAGYLNEVRIRSDKSKDARWAGNVSFQGGKSLERLLQ